MKNLFYLILLLFVGGVASAQTYNPISGKQDFKDSLKFSKYRNNPAGDSVLTIDPVTKKLKFTVRGLNPTQTYYGVDSITFSGNSLCQWSAGISICYTIVAPGNPAGGVDSVTVSGSNFCQWIDGDSTCYTITGNVLTSSIDSITVNGSNFCYWDNGVSTCFTISNITNNNYYIDSSITNVYNYIDSQRTINNFYTTNNSAKVSGQVVYDSLLVFHGTPFVYYINGRLFNSELTYVTIDAPLATENRTDVFYVDTLGNFGVLTGGGDGLVPQVDPASQLAVATVFVPSAESGLPIDIQNIDVYREHDSGEWDFVSDVPSINYEYPTNPYEGLKSIYVPNYTNNRYIYATDGETHDLSDVTFLKFQIRLTSPFRSNNRDYISVKFQEGTANRTGYEPVLSGTHGFDRQITGQWQEVTIPISEFTYTTTAFDRLYFNLTGQGTFQLDNIQIQTGTTGGPINVGQYVESVDNQFGPHVKLNYVDSARMSTDSLWYDYYNKRTGQRLFRLPSLYNVHTYDTCFVITTTDSVHFNLAFNRNCGGSGGNGIVESVTGLNTDNSDPANPVVRISTDGVTILGDGTPGNELTAVTGGTGTVTDFSAGDLSPLFTTSEATTTTTPALTFSQNNTSQYTFLGRSAAGSGAYSFLSASVLDSLWIADLHSETYYNTKYSLTTHNHTVDGLSNVTITSKASGDILRWNGSAWVNFVPTWITGNQTITLSGDVAGSGTTAITTTIGPLKVVNSMIDNGTIDVTAKITGVVPIANGGTNNGSLSVAAGTLYYGDGTKIVGISPGTSAQHLTGGAIPSWKDTAAVSSTTGWTITGNSGTTHNINFLGNTDSRTLRFRTNNIERARIDSSTGNFTSLYGLYADGTNIGLYSSAGTRFFDANNNFTFRLDGSNTRAMIMTSTALTLQHTGNINLSPTGTAAFNFLATSAGGIMQFGSVGNNTTTKYGVIRGATYSDFTNGKPMNLLFYPGNETSIGVVGNIFMAHDGSAAKGNVNIGTLTNVASALFNIESTTKGFLEPRMTTSQKTGIASAASGLSVYDTDTKQPSYYDGTYWQGQVGMTFGTAAPATTPTAVGNFFLDTTNKKLYTATGTASSADWTILN